MDSFSLQIFFWRSGHRTGVFFFVQQIERHENPLEFIFVWIVSNSHHFLTNSLDLQSSLKIWCSIVPNSFIKKKNKEVESRVGAATISYPP